MNMENTLIILSDKLVNVKHLVSVEKVKMNLVEYPFGLKFTTSEGMGNIFYEKYATETERDKVFDAISIQFGYNINI